MKGWRKEGKEKEQSTNNLSQGCVSNDQRQMMNYMK